MLTAVLATVLLSACSLIDDTLGECGYNDAQDYKLNYELRLVTNMTTELHTQLGLETDVSLSAALKEHLSGIFTDYAHDVDLSFYDTQGDSARLQHDQHIMNANQQSYTLYLPMREYMHLAVANVVDNPVVNLTNDERCHPSRLNTVIGTMPSGSVADTIDSHNTGVFTARLPMQVLEGVDQTFNVRLYMANCAVALVIDPREYDYKNIRVFSTGFASQFNICDSSFVFADRPPIVRAEKVEAPDENMICFATVNFPSKEPSATEATSAPWLTRSVIETLEPFISLPDKEVLWKVLVYITNADGTITETVLSIHQPLRAGQLKIIKGWIGGDGDVKTEDQTVGVNVTLDWHEGGHYEHEL